MWKRDQWRAFVDHPVTRWGIFGLGIILMILSPLAGVVPGPGGIFLFAIGLAMVLKTSMWAKRHYVRFKRWQPKAGRLTDWGLRRNSARRREALRKEQKSATPPLAADMRLDPASTPAPAAGQEPPDSRSAADRR